MLLKDLKDNYVDLGDYVITNDPLNWIVYSVGVVPEGKKVKDGKPKDGEEQKYKLVPFKNAGERQLIEKKWFPSNASLIRFIRQNAIFNKIADYEDCATFINALVEYDEKTDEMAKAMESYDWNNFKEFTGKK